MTMLPADVPHALQPSDTMADGVRASCELGLASVHADVLHSIGVA